MSLFGRTSLLPSPRYCTEQPSPITCEGCGETVAAEDWGDELYVYDHDVFDCIKHLRTRIEYTGNKDAT